MGNRAKQEEIDNMVIYLYYNNYSKNQIRKELLKNYEGMGENVPEIIQRLKEEGKISEPSKEELERKIKEMYEDDGIIEARVMKESLNTSGIPGILRVSESEIRMILEELKEAGKLDEDKAEEARAKQEAIREESKRKLKEMYESGIKTKVIQESLNITQYRRQMMLQELREAGKLDEDKAKEARKARKAIEEKNIIEAIEARDNKILPMYQGAIKLENISKELDIPITTVKSSVNRLRKIR